MNISAVKKITFPLFASILILSFFLCTTEEYLYNPGHRPTVSVGNDTAVFIKDTISLYGIAHDENGSIVKWEWNINGNGWYTSTDSTTIIADTYAKYVCSLKVTDNDGFEAIDGITILVMGKVSDIDGNTYKTITIGNLPLSFSGNLETKSRISLPTKPVIVSKTS